VAMKVTLEELPMAGHTLETPQDTFESPPQDTFESPPQDTFESLPQDTFESPPQDTFESPPQDTFESPPQDTFESPVEDNTQTNSTPDYSDSEILEASNFLFENTVSNEPDFHSNVQESGTEETTFITDKKNKSDHDGEDHIEKHIKNESVIEDNVMSDNTSKIKQEMPNLDNSDESIGTEISDSFLYSSLIQEEHHKNSDNEEVNKINNESEEISVEIKNILKDIQNIRTYTPSPIKQTLLPNVLEVIEPTEDAEEANVENEDMQKKLEAYLNEPVLLTPPLDESVSREQMEKTHLCQICIKPINRLEITRHYCYTHFLKELKTCYEDLVDGKTCISCNKSFATKDSAFLHVGRNHGKLNELLRKEGYAPISENHMKRKSETIPIDRSIDRETEKAHSKAKKVLNKQFKDTKIVDKKILRIDQIIKQSKEKSQDSHFIQDTEKLQKTKKGLNKHSSGTKVVNKKSLKIAKRIKQAKEIQLTAEKVKQEKDIPITDGKQKHVCQICSKVMQRDMSYTWMHYGSHLLSDLTANYGDLVVGKKCISCDKTYKTVNNLSLHIGRTHEKTNELLVLRGLVPLPLLRENNMKIVKEEHFKTSEKSGLGQLKRLRSFRNYFKSEKNAYDLVETSELIKSKESIELIDGDVQKKEHEYLGFHCQAVGCKIILKNKEDLPRHHKVHVDIPDKDMAVKNLETGEILYTARENSEEYTIPVVSKFKKGLLSKKIQKLKIKLKNRSGNYNPAKSEMLDSLPGTLTTLREIEIPIQPSRFSVDDENVEGINLSIDQSKTDEIETEKTYPAVYYRSNSSDIPIVTKKVEVCIDNSEISFYFQKQLQKQNPEQNTASLTCQLCREKKADHSLLWQHYFFDHLFTEMYLKFGSLVTRNMCALCGKKFSENVDSLKHLGKFHGKVNDLLISKGLHPIFVSEDVKTPKRAVTVSKSMSNLKSGFITKELNKIEDTPEVGDKIYKADKFDPKPTAFVNSNVKKEISFEDHEKAELDRISAKQTRNFNCDVCFIILNGKDDASEHKLKCENYRLSCSFCGNNLETLECLEGHKKNCKDRQSYLFSVFIPKYATL